MTFRTVVTLTPRVTRLSAIQPPTLLVMAIVIHGSTLKMPLFMRSKPSTWAQGSLSAALGGTAILDHVWVTVRYEVIGAPITRLA